MAGSGCRRSVARQDARDRDLPEVRRAIAREQEGDLDQAITQYEEALMVNPRAASAHLGLALLLHDHRRDYVDAIHHYRRYLNLRAGTEKQGMIQDRLRVAEQLLAADSLKRLSESGAGANAIFVQQIQASQQRISQLETDKARLTDSQAKLTLEAASLRAEVARLQRWVDRLQVPGGADTAGTAGISSPRARPLLPDESPGRTYEVKVGDSLSRIAEKVYGDPTLWPRIRDANRDKIRDERVQVGQVLTIP